MPCCHHCAAPAPRDPRYGRVLWAALAINVALLLIETAAGLAAGSASLQADALDFLADSANYAISLSMLDATLRVRSRVALVKGLSMGAFGLWVLGSTAWHVLHGSVPRAETMGWVGMAAMIANGAVFGLLWAHRGGDSDMRSVWLCSRNDVLGNGAVLLAALGVFGTGTGWPDVLVAAAMAGLALQGAARVVRAASAEARGPRPAAVPAG